MFTEGNVDRYMSAKCRRGIGNLKSYVGRHTCPSTVDRVAVDSRSTLDRHSIDTRSTLDRESTECRSTVDRLSTATSTDIAVDIAVDITYSKHDPNWPGSFRKGFAKFLAVTPRWSPCTRQNISAMY